MAGISFAAALLIWGLLPGLLLLRFAGVTWSLAERAAAAPGVSLAIVAAVAYLVEIAGLPVRPLPVLAAIAVMCAGLFAVRRRMPGAAELRHDDWPGALPAYLRWLPWLIWLAPFAVVAQLEPVTGATLLPPPLHDGLDHANWFRLIYETGSVNPHDVLAPPLGPTGEPSYYPWGLHVWAALLAQTTALEPVTVWTRALIAVSAALPLSVYVLTAYLSGRGWAAMAAALLSLVFWWVPYQIWGWGGYPLLAGAIAALPVCRLALSAVTARNAAAIAAACACLAGLLLIHPSQLFFALIAMTVVSVVFAAGRVIGWRDALPFVLALAVASLALTAGGAAWQPVADFMQKAREVSVTIAADPRYRWPIGAWFDTELPLPAAIRLRLNVLCAIGAAACVLHARLRPLLALHLVFGGLVLLARYQSWPTSLWYHMPERIWYAQAATVPALAAVGLAAVLLTAARLTRRWIELPRWHIVAWPLLLWLVFPPMHERFVPWANWRLYRAAHRNPRLTITDRRVLADFAWMRANIPPGEILFNAPADWGLPLPFTGHRTVFWSGGYAIDPETAWNEVLNLMRRGDPYTSRAGAELSALGIHYVYAARLSPALEDRGRLPLDGSALKQAAGFEVLYESETALILRAADVRRTLLGIQDSGRVRFEGFYAPEQRGNRRWRWSAGKGRIVIDPAGQTGAECFARIFGPGPDTFEVRHDGVALGLTSRGYRIVRGPDDEEAIAIDILSPGAAPEGGSGTRVLGTRITNVGFTCGN